MVRQTQMVYTIVFVLLVAYVYVEGFNLSPMALHGSKMSSLRHLSTTSGLRVRLHMEASSSSHKKWSTSEPTLGKIQNQSNTNKSKEQFYPFPAGSSSMAISSSGDSYSSNSGIHGELMQRQKRPNPLKRMMVLTVLFVKVGVMRVKYFFLTLWSFFVALVTGKNAKYSTLSPRVQKLIAKLRNRTILTRLFISVSIFLSLKRYVAYTKSLTTELSFASFLSLVNSNPERIQFLKVAPSGFFFKLDGKSAFVRKVALETSIMSLLLQAGIDFSAPPAPPNVLGIFWTCVYAAFMWNITTKMMQGPQDSGAGSRKDEILKNSNLSFDDIAGQEKAKLEVAEVCTMLREPARYKAVGARLPAGVLLIGPPGTGKTLLARVTAAEAGVPFYACSASDFVEVFVGRGPARVRKLFQKAAKNAPCIIFIDELDSIGRSRRAGSMNSEQENTLNQILTAMDGLDTSNNGVVVMAATNRLELLDPALLRAGRFDRIVQCPLPDKVGREAILKVHCKRYVLTPDVDMGKIARLTIGTSGADLSAIANEAAIRAARRGAISVNGADFDGALETFFSGRSAQVGSIIEAAVPDWLKRTVGRNPQTMIES